MQLEEVGKYLLRKLKEGLPGQLPYHNVAHTVDVYMSTEHISRREGVGGHDLNLLLSAALFHDSGFLVGSNGHEEESCRIARETLPKFEYTTDEIDTICQMIMTTSLPQSPKNKLENILADADLDYLGRHDFLKISKKLYDENFALGLVSNEIEWDEMQIKFLKNHKYFTNSSIKLREPIKYVNLLQIEDRLKKARQK